MTAIVIAFLGIAATLVATWLASRTQSRAAALAERAEDERRISDRRTSTSASFAGHVIEYRRAELHRWHEVNRSRIEGAPSDPDMAASANEVRTSRSSAWGDLYMLRLLWDDADLLQRAERVLRRASDIEHASDEKSAKSVADSVRGELSDLADTARRSVTS